MLGVEVLARGARLLGAAKAEAAQAEERDQSAHRKGPDLAASQVLARKATSSRPPGLDGALRYRVKREGGEVR